MKIYLLFALVVILAINSGCSGKEVVESAYENGNPRVVRYYHESRGNLILDREIVFYENTQKKMEGRYKDELRDGKWKAWYENGTPWSVGEYRNGKRDGISIAYHKNGNKYIEGNYRADIRVGNWRFYDTTGAMTKEVNFDLVPHPLGSDSLK
jgi:antitoxin component YwqK of YwqJK toxin-antitoxin module